MGRVYATEQDYLFAWLRLFHRLQFSCAGSWFVAKVSTARLGFYIQRPGGVCFVVYEAFAPMFLRRLRLCEGQGSSFTVVRFYGSPKE